MLPSEIDHWRDMLDFSEQPTVREFVATTTAAGDACMYRVYYHVQNSNYNITEQIDKNSG